MACETCRWPLTRSPSSVPKKDRLSRASLKKRTGQNQKTGDKIKQKTPLLSVPKDIRPDYRHGQNFLLDPDILDREIAYANITPEDQVLEIGPGIAHLTRKLTQKAGHVHAFEIDRQFESLLSDLATETGTLTLHWGDAAALSWPDVNKVVANLPYKMSLPLIFRILETETIELAVVIIQERLARRLAAKPGQNGYSRISVSLQRVATAQVLEVVKDRAFSPPPQIDSAMLRLKRIRPRFTFSDPDYGRNCLDYFFLRRDSALAEAVADLRPEAALRRALSHMPKTILKTPIFSQAPESLGKLAEALWRESVDIPKVTTEEKQKSQQLFRPK